MTLGSLLSRLGPALERAQIPYMLTGSVASSAHGMPRSTLDLDIVIAPTQPQLLKLINEFPSSDYYADKQQSLEALARRSQFNVIDFATGWKVDFIIAEDTEYGRTAFGRRRGTVVAGVPVFITSPEDVILAKLRWAKLGGSERQLQDAAGIIKAQRDNLDIAYVERWACELGLEVQWQVAREASQ